jgi:hypothetical protein
VSLYREPGRARRRRRLIAAAIAGGLILIAVVVVLVSGGASEPSASDRAASARSAATQALDRLEILDVEYENALGQGTAASPTEYAGATGHIEAARRVVASHAADFRAVDPAAFVRAEDELRRVAVAVDGHTPLGQFRASVAAARAALETFT